MSGCTLEEIHRDFDDILALAIKCFYATVNKDVVNMDIMLEQSIK